MDPLWTELEYSRVIRVIRMIRVFRVIIVVHMWPAGVHRGS
jgi:hypothetical protein